MYEEAPGCRTVPRVASNNRGFRMRVDEMASNLCETLVEGMVTEGIECLRRVEQPLAEATAAAAAAAAVTAEEAMEELKPAMQAAANVEK